MHVQHTSVQTREKRHQRIEDAEKRRQYRVAHGLEEEQAEEKSKAEAQVVDDQSPIAAEPETTQGEGYVDWEGKRRPVKKWLGIW
jgi:TolA-binding protein